MAKSNRHTDINQLAKSIVEIIPSQSEVPEAKNAAAVALGRLGGLKGAKARAARLTAKKSQK
jgi:hypothetical protein